MWGSSCPLVTRVGDPGSTSDLLQQLPKSINATERPPGDASLWHAQSLQPLSVVWFFPCNLPDDHFCSKGIMTRVRDLWDGRFGSQMSPSANQRVWGSEQVWTKVDCVGGALLAGQHFTARAANCCKKKKKATTLRKKKERRCVCISAGCSFPPSLSLFSQQQQACDSWVSLTAAFSWGEIKRLGDMGTCWPQEPKQCLI